MPIDSFTDALALGLISMLPIAPIGVVLGVLAAIPTASRPTWNWWWAFLVIPSLALTASSASLLGYIIWALYNRLE